MCGICGLFNLDGQTMSNGVQVLLDGMCRQLRHRGPDETGLHVEGPAALGHVRLSIIDPGSGQQPMANEDASIWITFNGEIFNYLELRNILEGRGHRFRTRSDTEVLVHMYEEYGQEMLEYLNGQFAFAIFDSRRQELFLARDHFGICPLFYLNNGGRFAFASEVKALAEIPGISLEFDPMAISQLFTFWTVISPRTPFREICSIPPGGCMSVSTSGLLGPKQYWCLKFPRRGEEDLSVSEEEWKQRVLEAVVEAARIRLRADVPVGVYLSGGVDSSIIATTVKRLTDTPIEAFSLAFADSAYDESGFQSRLAQAIGVNHNVIRVRNREIGRVFPDVMWHTERPVLRAAPAPLFMLSGLVKQKGYKVVLTGEGADELFGGYDIFKEDKIRRFWAREPDSACRPILLNRLYPHAPVDTSRAGRMLAAFYRKNLLPTDVFAYSHLPTWNNTRALQGFFTRSFMEELEGYDPVDELKACVPGEFHLWHPLHQAQFLEARILLSEYLLSSQGERMTMGHSVEGRYPFLDPGVARLATMIPPSYKLKGLREKYILRKAFAELLPAEFAERPKRPYLAPNKESFLEEPGVSRIHEYLDPNGIKSCGVFDGIKVERLLKKCSRGGGLGFRDNAAFLGILSTQIIWEEFVSGRGVIRNFAS